ncbi:MAG TPA: hypothetical protein VJM51_02505, partial [Dehalococcoidia bacterium]|nr:hypothetical protein [Dehalococcoidia bacterium]
PPHSLAPYDSGFEVFVDRAEFDYIGPPRTLALGWGLKPKTGFFGTDFNNGNNLVRGAWDVLGITVPGAAAWQRMVEDGLHIGFVVPLPGAQVLEGGGSGSLSGWVDTWVWITDLAAILDSGLPFTRSLMTQEKFFLVLTADSEQIDVALPPAVQSPAVSALQVRYNR